MDKRQITLRVTVTATDEEGQQLAFAQKLPRNCLFRFVGNFARSYSRENSAATWFSSNAETIVCFLLARVSEGEADLISDRLEEMGAATDVTLMVSSFTEAARRALGDGVELVKITE